MSWTQQNENHVLTKPYKINIFDVRIPKKPNIDVQPSKRVVENHFGGKTLGIFDFCCLFGCNVHVMLQSILTPTTPTPGICGDLMSFDLQQS